MNHELTNHELTNPDLAKFLNQETKTPNRQIEYAASPYWHLRREVRQARATAAAAAVLELIKGNKAAVFSPVVYSAVPPGGGRLQPAKGLVRLRPELPRRSRRDDHPWRSPAGSTAAAS